MNKTTQTTKQGRKKDTFTSNCCFLLVTFSLQLNVQFANQPHTHTNTDLSIDTCYFFAFLVFQCHHHLSVPWIDRPLVSFNSMNGLDLRSKASNEKEKLNERSIQWSLNIEIISFVTRDTIFFYFFFFFFFFILFLSYISEHR